MIRLALIATMLAIFLPHQAFARKITVGFAAVPVREHKPAGHAWVIIAITDDDGKTSIRGYGWYPQVGVSDQSFPGALTLLFGGLLGSGVPGKLNSTDLLLRGYVYLQKDISELELKSVEKVITDEQQSPSKTYDALINNCVSFSSKLATAVGLNSPSFGTFANTPAIYMGNLAAANRKYLIPLPRPDKDIKVDIGDKWKVIIDEATNYDSIIRDLRWRAYQPQHISQIQNAVNAVEQQRASVWAAAWNQNRAVLDKQIADERAYVTELQQDHDQNAGYGAGSSNGSVNWGSSSGGAPAGTPPDCSEPVCIFDGPHTASLRWKTLLDQNSQNIKVGLSLRAAAKPPKFTFAAGSPTPPVEEGVLFGVGSEWQWRSLQALMKPFGNTGLIDIGPIAKGGNVRFRIAFENVTSKPLDISLVTTGTKLKATWTKNGHLYTCLTQPI